MTSMRKPIISSVVEALPHNVPFVGPEQMERNRGRRFRARLGANESAFGPSPLAIAAMADAAREAWKYCDPESYELREAVARFHGVHSANVVIGEGIDGLLGLAVKIGADPGTSVVTSDGAYPTFNFHVAAQGARIVKVPFLKDHEDLEGLLATAKRERARVLYVSNPNNPMGSWWSASEIERLIDGLPDGLLLLLDEAYCDTAPECSIPCIDVSNPQVLRLRTFSKAYGLAGARIGYAVGEKSLISNFEKVRNHYGINRTGQIGALAAIADQAYLVSAVERISQARERIASIARDSGLQPIPSGTNFVAIDCGYDGSFAKAVLDGLISRDVFARKPGAPGLDRCIRVSCGLNSELDFFAEMLPLAISAARNAM
jgi:histidinol-phosphate aminotransferase